MLSRKERTEWFEARPGRFKGDIDFLSLMATLRRESRETRGFEEVTLNLELALTL